MKWLVLVLSVCDVILAALDGHCPPLGPVLRSPTNPTAHESVHSASIHENGPLLESHHTPSMFNKTGPTTIASQTVYRPGSISRIFAVLALIQQSHVRMDDSITEYVPALLQLMGETPEVNDISTVKWEEVTIGVLVSHMSGIGMDLVNDLSSIPIDGTQFGSPKLDDSSKNRCAGVLGLPPCNRTQSFRDFGKRHPVYAPFTSPVYSNVASVILGFAVEAITNMTYNNYVKQSILEPLSMTNTTIFNGPENNAWRFVPVNETWWGAPLGYENMAGDFDSNTVDLLFFGADILKHSLLPLATTRKWMKPSTVTKDKRLVESYCKAGNLNTYNNMVCLVPGLRPCHHYLLGGPDSSASLVDSALTKLVRALLPAIEDAGKAEARPRYAGTCMDAATNSSLALSLDDDDAAAAPGLAVKSWVVRDVDVVKNYARFSTVSSSPTDLPVRVRLYPTNLSADGRTAWRAVFDFGTPKRLAAKDTGSFWPDASCHTWGSMDRLTCGFSSIDEFVFELVAEGVAKGVELRAFRVGLSREA
ncbi:beta-lactamase/transpeptidase-like protein [Xylariaceae sp. FL0662B]|nr:beta-lactamase/transpeptidase-like protein [Xylariaceae sp. FL0662B]